MNTEYDFKQENIYNGLLEDADTFLIMALDDDGQIIPIKFSKKDVIEMASKLGVTGDDL